MMERPKLVKYKGWHWKWWGGKDERGWLDLQHIKHPSQGVLADPAECEIQDADYFENLPGFPPPGA
jgi:hypothetical protein